MKKKIKKIKKKRKNSDKEELRKCLRFAKTSVFWLLGWWFAVAYVAVYLYIMPPIGKLPLLMFEFVLLIVVALIGTFARDVYKSVSLELLYFAIIFRLLTVREHDECLNGTCEVDKWVSYTLLGVLVIEWSWLLYAKYVCNTMPKKKVESRVLPEAKAVPVKESTPGLIHRVPDFKFDLNL